MAYADCSPGVAAQFASCFSRNSQQFVSDISSHLVIKKSHNTCKAVSIVIWASLRVSIFAGMRPFARTVMRSGVLAGLNAS
eukprot:376318-Amphidinium_carterae.1